MSRCILRERNRSLRCLRQLRRASRGRLLSGGALDDDRLNLRRSRKRRRNSKRARIPITRRRWDFGHLERTRRPRDRRRWDRRVGQRDAREMRVAHRLARTGHFSIRRRHGKGLMLWDWRHSGLRDRHHGYRRSVRVERHLLLRGGGIERGRRGNGRIGRPSRGRGRNGGFRHHYNLWGYGHTRHRVQSKVTCDIDDA